MAATTATPTWRAKSGSPQPDADPPNDLLPHLHYRRVNSGTAAVRSLSRSIVHTTHAAHTAAWHGQSLLLLRRLGDHGLGGDHETGDRRSVLQRDPHDLRRIDDAGVRYVDILLGLGVESRSSRPSNHASRAHSPRCGAVRRHAPSFFARDLATLEESVPMATPRSFSRSRSSASVMSLLAATAERISSACASIRCEWRSPPWRLGLTSPSRRPIARHRIALDALTRSTRQPALNRANDTSTKVNG
jgi:hypothetical protein